ncbi:hypothetical protein CLV35_0681 [Motilibacter peucedani]|uniref:Uncharacterized protein n=1 Tax=Motilibacter peucedani TaxID=598650 RepID=A0A420XTT2_9ACTN|nr:hypothetical protein [Motilibacter peucedani]RKS80256.1 hypothetical protein CLV35_0681 [Motilibacter peucedani]
MAATHVPARPTVLHVVLWALAGVCSSATLLAAFTAWSLAGVAGAVLLGWVAVRHHGSGRAALGLLLGLAACLLLVAWLNRNGPGTVCSTDAAGSTTCTDEWSPWPWLAAALLLAALAVGGVLGARRDRSAGRAASPKRARGRRLPD